MSCVAILLLGICTGRAGADMKLELTKGFKKKTVISSEAELKKVYGEPTAYAKKGINPAYYGKATIVAGDEKVKHSHSLQQTYLDGPPKGWTWHHVPNQKLDTPDDVKAMFEALVCAATYYVTWEQGVDPNDHKDKIAQEVKTTIDVWVKVNLTKNVGGVFDVDMLVRAVTLRVCGDDTWSNAWIQFFAGLYDKHQMQQVNDGLSVIFKDTMKVTCDETNNSSADIEAGKLNVDVVVPVPAEHIDMKFVMAESGVKFEDIVDQNKDVAAMLQATSEMIRQELEPLMGEKATQLTVGYAKKVAEDVIAKLGHGGVVPIVTLNDGGKLVVDLTVKTPDAAVELKVDPNQIDSGTAAMLAKWKADVMTAEEYAKADAACVPKGNQPVPCAPPKPLMATKVPITDLITGESIAQPAEGWYVGDDFCWHPPIKEIDFTEQAKQIDADAFKMIATLDHPAAQFDALKSAVMKTMSEEQAKQIASDLVLYGQAFVDEETGEVVDPAKVQKHVGVSMGCQASVGPDGHLVQESPLVATPVLKKVATYDPLPVDVTVGNIKAGEFWFNTSTGKLWMLSDSGTWAKAGGVQIEPVHLEEDEGKVILVPAHKTPKTWGVNYTDHSNEQLDLVKMSDPAAKNSLMKAMVEEIQKEVEAEVMKSAPQSVTVMSPIQPLHVNKNGDSFSNEALDSMKKAQEAFLKATMIPPQYLGVKVTNTE